MSLWVDKYRPTSLRKLDFHLTQAEHLKNVVRRAGNHLKCFRDSLLDFLVIDRFRAFAHHQDAFIKHCDNKFEKTVITWTCTSKVECITKLCLCKVDQGDFPHLLFYGPSGAGKKTRIMALLKELYGPSVERLRMEQLNFTTPSNKKIDIMTVASNYHIEVNPSDAGIYDRIVVMELIKNAAQTHQLDSSGQREFKVIVLTEVDRLTKDAQHALRRTMEKYIATCRLILCANSISQVIAPIKSRCLPVRVSAPSYQQIEAVLQSVCRKEGLILPQEFAEKIAERSDRNLRRAILMCETCKVQQYPFTLDQEIMEPDWQLYIRDTAKLILSEQSPKKLIDVRSRLYELLVHGIPTDIIFKGLVKELGKNCDMELRTKLVALASTYEYQMHKGSKVIFYLEAFVANFMSMYLRFIEESVGNAF